MHANLPPPPPIPTQWPRAGSILRAENRESRSCLILFSTSFPRANYCPFFVYFKSFVKELGGGAVQRSNRQLFEAPVLPQALAKVAPSSGRLGNYLPYIDLYI